MSNNGLKKDPEGEVVKTNAHLMNRPYKASCKELPTGFEFTGAKLKLGRSKFPIPYRI